MVGSKCSSRYYGLSGRGAKPFLEELKILLIHIGVNDVEFKRLFI
jgi:hypothetical protein